MDQCCQRRAGATYLRFHSLRLRDLRTLPGVVPAAAPVGSTLPAVAKKSRFTLVGGAGVGLGIIILIAILGLPSQYDNLTSANIISASWGYDSLKPGQVMPRQEILPLKTQSDPDHPVYAYLHPETPPAQLLADKNAPPTRPGKEQRLRKPVARGQALKATAHTPKKDKAPGKHQAKNNKNKKKKAAPLNKELAANIH